VGIDLEIVTTEFTCQYR